MKIHPVVTQNAGMISVTLQATFVGDVTDDTDRELIAAFGDPLVNIAGTFIDPSDSTFTFQFPATEKYVKLMSEMQNRKVSFMSALPLCGYHEWQVGPSYIAGAELPQPNLPGPLQCLVSDPAKAAAVWLSVMTDSSNGRILQALTQLRSNSVLPSAPDVTL